MGIIDSLAAGFQTVARRPWLLLIPIVLDLFLWLGPKLSMAPVLDQLGVAYHDALIKEQALFERLTGDPSQIEVFDRQMQELLAQLKDINLFSLLAWQMPSLLQSVAQFGPDERLGLPPALIITIPTAGRLAIAIAGLVLVGLFVTSAYSGLIAQYVRTGQFDRSSFFDRLPVNWLRLVGFYLLIAIIAAGLGLPVLILGGLLNLVAPALGAALVWVLLLMALWVIFVLLFFVSEAIFVGDLNPLAAMRSSIQVVRRSFFSSLGLIFLTYLIAVGTFQVWTYLPPTSVSILVAIIGNAFISTGLAAAGMIFYRDRMKDGQPGRLAAT